MKSETKLTRSVEGWRIESLSEIRNGELTNWERFTTKLVEMIGKVLWLTNVFSLSFRTCFDKVGMEVSTPAFTVSTEFQARDVADGKASLDELREKIEMETSIR